MSEDTAVKRQITTVEPVYQPVDADALFNGRAPSGRGSKWDSVAQRLRANPGQWAIVAQYDGIEAAKAGNMAQRLRKQYEGIQFVSRQSLNASGHTVSVVAGYCPNPERDADSEVASVAAPVAPAAEAAPADDLSALESIADSVPEVRGNVTVDPTADADSEYDPFAE